MSGWPHVIGGEISFKGIWSQEDQTEVLRAELKRVLPPGKRIKSSQFRKNGDVLHYTLELEERKVVVGGVEV